MKILVTGGTGTIGSHLVPELLKRNASVRVLSRDPQHSLHRYENVEWARGDLEAPNSLDRAFEQVDTVFLLLGMSQTETAQGIAAVQAAKQAGVRKIVFLSVPMLEHMLHIPHIKGKIGIEEAIKRSGMAYTILRPNNFFQNDLWLQEAIMQYGVYPMPFGSVGLHRVDAADIANAAANALLLDGYENQEFPLVGPEALTGEKIAETYALHVGKAVQYAGDDLDAWYQQAIRAMPEWLAKDFRVMYEAFQKQGCLGTEQDFMRQRELLLRDPRPFDSFVADTVTLWKQ